MPSVHNWKSPAEVVRLRRIAKARSLGEGHFGFVWPGRMKFRDKKTRRVAIKIFHHPLSDGKAARYQAVIDRLHAAGVPMPKMSMAKLPTERCPWGEWVQVSEIFSRGGQSKLCTVPIKFTQELYKQKIQIYARCILAGFFPPIECIGYLANNQKTCVMDLDGFVHDSPTSIGDRLDFLHSLVISENKKLENELRLLVDNIFSNDPKLQAEWKKVCEKR
jgi:hypothetical protein